jgi:hypothetical protein
MQVLYLRLAARKRFFEKLQGPTGLFQFPWANNLCKLVPRLSQIIPVEAGHRTAGVLFLLAACARRWVMPMHLPVTVRCQQVEGDVVRVETVVPARSRVSHEKQNEVSQMGKRLGRETSRIACLNNMSIVATHEAGGFASLTSTT